MPTPDTFDSAPTVLLDGINLEKVEKLLSLPKDSTLRLTGSDAEQFAMLTKIRQNVRDAHPTWTDPKIDEYLREQFRANPREQLR